MTGMPGRVDSKHAARLMRLASYASIGVSLLLIATKLGAWLLTGSVSVLSSLLDSLLDSAASVVNLLAIRTAVSPADQEHRFGHGKAEPLASLGQSAFIAGSAVLLLVEGGHRLFSPEPVEHSRIGIAAIGFSMAATLLLIPFQKFVVRRTGSLAIGADELHYRGDLLLNGGVILALVLTELFGWPFLDSIFGAAIAVWIVYSAWQIARRALTQLMDREMPDDDRQRIRTIALAHPEVSAVHDLRTRLAGPSAFVQIHIEMSADMTLRRAHEVADTVEASIIEAFPYAEVIIHQDPAGIPEVRRTFAPARRKA